MKRLVLLCLILLVAGAWLGEKMIQDPGYALFAYKDTTVETSLWILLLLGLVLFLLGYGLLRLLSGLRGSGRKLERWNQQRQQRRSQRQTLKGLMAFSEGNWNKAQRYLTLGANNAELPLVNYLAAARAASELKQPEACEELLQQARQETPRAEVAIAITQAETLLRQGQLEPCLAILKRLQRQSPDHTYVLRLLQKVYARLQDWQGLKELLPRLRKNAVLSDSDLSSLEQQTHAALLQRLAEELPVESESSEKIKVLTSAWSDLPNDLQKRPPMVAGFARLLASVGGEAQAERQVRDLLKQTWDDDLVDLYGRLAAESPDKQLKQVQQWLKERPKDALLLLAAGRVALRNEQWDKARDYFEASLKHQPSQEVFCELIRLLTSLGEQEASQTLVRDSLGLLSQELPSLPLPNQPQPAKV